MSTEDRYWITPPEGTETDQTLISITSYNVNLPKEI